MPKSDHIHMRIAPELKARLVAAAQRRYLDTSTIATMAILSWLDANEPVATSDVSPRRDNDDGE